MESRGPLGELSMSCHCEFRRKHEAVKVDCVRDVDVPRCRPTFLNNNLLVNAVALA